MPLANLNDDYSTTKQCGGNFLPIVLLIKPSVLRVKDRSTSQAVKISIMEHNIQLSEINLSIETPPTWKMDFDIYKLFRTIH